MMKHAIYLTKNNQETLEKLKSLGFYICPCCTFKDVKWLNFYTRPVNNEDKLKKEFHGIGYSCENKCEDANPYKCITCVLEESIKYNKEIHIYNDVDECVKSINEHYE